MKTACYLKVKSNGSVSVSKNRPYTDINEVAVGLTIDLPDVLFKRPQIEASITVASDNVQPFHVDADTTNLVKNAIQSATGFEVKLTVINPEITD